MCKDTQKEMNIQREVKKTNDFNENILFHAQNRLTLQAKHLHLHLLVNRKRLYLSVVCLTSVLWHQKFQSRRLYCSKKVNNVNCYSLQLISMTVAKAQQTKASRRKHFFTSYNINSDINTTLIYDINEPYGLNPHKFLSKLTF